MSETIERVYIAVDVSNLWLSCRDIFGPTARVNYGQLLEKLKVSGYQGLTREVTAVAYTITTPYRRTSESGRVHEESSRNSRFLESLEKLGYLVKTREMRYEKGIHKPFHTDWDIGLTIDVITAQDQFDTFIIVSGDGDYVPLIKRLQEKDKRVEIYTFERTSSKRLFSLANNMTYLTEADIYQEKI